MAQSATTVIRHHQIDEAYSVVFHDHYGRVYASLDGRIKKISHCTLSTESARFPKFGPLCEFDSREVEDLVRAYKIEDPIPSQTTPLDDKLKDLTISGKKAPDSSSVGKLKTVKDQLLSVPTQDSDSDHELPECEPEVFIFERRKRVLASTVTISCTAEEGMPLNVKGSTLIEIVHEAIKCWYCIAVDMASEYEKDLDGPVISAPLIQNDIIHISEPKDWVMSLGGWKGMMPSEEIKNYFFSDDIKKGGTFKGACINDNGEIFEIKDNRIHIPQGFSVCGFDVTGHWKKAKNKLSYVSSGKSDLSYSQIIAALKKIKKKTGLSDSQLASIQLHRISNYSESKTVFPQNVSGSDKKEILIFLDYLNALMFGIEPSGLNAGIATGLMTLDLIRDGLFTYKIAFKANDEGGVYPFACFGDNKGTYTRREDILIYKKSNIRSLSMKSLRDKPSLSPIAIKEAALIKMWLKANDVVLRDLTYSEQLVTIERAIDDLLTYYLSPWFCRKIWRLEKFVKLRCEEIKFVKDKRLSCLKEAELS